MLGWDPSGKQGPKTPLPDLVTIHTPKDDVIVSVRKEEEYVAAPLGAPLGASLAPTDVDVVAA